MNDAMALAALWKRNKAVVGEWMDDYCTRTGSTHEDVIADRKAHWIRDSLAEKIGMFRGYELSVIQIGENCWRYTTITPWGTSEGLCDLNVRDDDATIAYLAEVDAKMDEEAARSDPKPIKMEKMPSRASERVIGTPKMDAKPTERRRRGRPKAKPLTLPLFG